METKCLLFSSNFLFKFCLSHSLSSSSPLFSFSVSNLSVFHFLYYFYTWALSVSSLSSLSLSLCHVSFLPLYLFLLTPLSLQLPPCCLQEQTGVETQLSVQPAVPKPGIRWFTYSHILIPVVTLSHTQTCKLGQIFLPNVEEMTFTPQTEWKLGVRISASMRMRCILSSQTCVPLYAHCICRSAEYFLKWSDWVFQQGGACAICLQQSGLESNWWLLLYAIPFLCCLSFLFCAYNLRKIVKL